MSAAFLDGVSPRELAARIENQPDNFFAKLAGIDDRISRGRITNLALQYLAAVDLKGALVQLSKTPQLLISSETIEEMGSRLAGSGEDLSSELKGLSHEQRLQLLRTAAASLVMDSQKAGNRGRFPSEVFFGHMGFNETFIRSVIEAKGGPLSAGDLNEWVSGLESAQLTALSALACRSFGEEAPRAAMALLDSRDGLLPENRAYELALLSGIAKRYPKEAVQRALIEGEGPESACFILTEWLDRDSIRASGWVATNSNIEVRGAFHETVAMWAERNGLHDEARLWRTLPID